MAQRAILHLDLDAFFVSVEALKNPALRGRPVVVGGSGDRGVVAAASYEARRYGIHAAMPARQARQLCPQALFVRGDFESYGRYSDLVTEVLQDQAPVLEKASIDEFYVDMTGMERFSGALRWAQELKKKVVHETGLSLTIGLSENKTVSKVAVGEHKPNGQVQIDYGQERAFLAPLDVGRIPMVGERTAHLLKTMGVYRVGTLAQVPVQRLEGLLGKPGRDLWHKANGHDASPVVPYQARKSLSAESTFSTDTTDVTFLRRELLRMLTELTYQLRQQQETTGCLTVKIRYANFDTHTRQVTLPYTSSDAVLLQAAQEAFERLYDRRLLVRLLGVRLSKLCRSGAQLALFDASACALSCSISALVSRLNLSYTDDCSLSSLSTLCATSW